MAGVGEGRKASDRRRVRAARVVSTAHTGRSVKGNMLGHPSRIAEFSTGISGARGKNGRA